MGALLALGGFGGAAYLVGQWYASTSCRSAPPCAVPLPPYLDPFVYLGIVCGLVGVWMSIDALTHGADGRPAAPRL